METIWIINIYHLFNAIAWVALLGSLQVILDILRHAILLIYIIGAYFRAIV